jgi:hypothetical protein
MLAIKVGLVDTTGTVDTAMMATVAAALNIQVTRDLPQYWNVSATVSYLPDPHKIPQGVWPIQLVKSLPPGEGGFHMTKHNQPYAKVIVSAGSDDWTVDASHECLEMLVDPNGNRLQTSTAIAIVDNAIKDGTGQFEYLVEACDPCEANNYAYPINGVSVSDFLTPHFYDLRATPGSRYSFTGAIERPREILPGGYISWVDPQTDEMQQILWVDPTKPPQLVNLGPASGASLRVFVENKTLKHVHDKRVGPSKETVAARKAARAHRDEVAAVRAKHYV